MALNSLHCAEVPLRNCSLTHSLIATVTVTEILYHQKTFITYTRVPVLNGRSADIRQHNNCSLLRLKVLLNVQLNSRSFQPLGFNLRSWTPEQLSYLTITVPLVLM